MTTRSAHDVATLFAERMGERGEITLSRKQLAWLMPLAAAQGRALHRDDYYVQPAWDDRHDLPTFRVTAFPGRAGGRLSIVREEC